MVPERKIGTIGGAMDLAVGAKKLIVVMNHVTKEGKPRVVKQCTYPITAIESVALLVTDIAVIEVTKKGLVLKEVAPGWTPAEVQKLTEPKLIVDPGCHDIELM
jgi:3-oxoacid CoA-transferase B subunit